MDQPFPYEIQRIPIGSRQEEIRRAYRRLAMQYHPDRNPAGPDAEEKCRKIQRACETLSAPKGGVMS